MVRTPADGSLRPLIPAQAGIQTGFAGFAFSLLAPRFRGDERMMKCAPE
jgi:hypothetical protein